MNEMKSCVVFFATIGVQLEGQNFDFNAHSCRVYVRTWIKYTLSTSKISAVEMPRAPFLVKFQFEDTYPQEINTNR